LKKAEVTTEPFPNRLRVRKWPEMYEIIARDAFLDSLCDPALRVRGFGPVP